MATTKRAATFRLSDIGHERIARIAEATDGLTATRIVENALALYARKVLGRRDPARDPDLVPPRAREGRPARGA